MMRAIGLLVLAGCGRIGFDGFGVDVDAQRGDPIALDTVPPDPAFDPVNCPTSYTLQFAASPTTRYRSVTASVTWLEAVAACNADATSASAYTHLAVVGSDAEMAELAVLLSQPWLGFSDRLVEGTFVASTAEDLGGYLQLESTGWGANEPNGGPTENCGQLKSQHFNDRACDAKHGFICECDAFANDPSRY